MDQLHEFSISYPTSGNCEVYGYISSGTQVCQYIPWAVFSAMRAFALSSRTWPLALGSFLFSLVSRATLIIADLLVLAITWNATFEASQHDVRALGQPSSGDQAASSMAYILGPLTAILVSRFLIDLQEANNALMHQSSLSSMPSLVFNRFIGSLGAPLPAPNLTFEHASVHENQEQPEERSGGEEADAATLQAE
ncbi:hypothetical protein C8Q76DRAFT_367041 [Earliella scabrosa]|nr:hypothetical protein C8Q76DRAFT_367041 [Earliella scabrosa]